MVRDESSAYPVSALLSVLEPSAHPARVIHRLVAMTRERLGLDVSFVSEFGGGQRVFRFVDGDTASFDIEVDAGDPLEDTYCQRIVSGSLPGVIRDTGADPVTRELAITEGKDIGAYIGVPVVFSDGQVFGTFCAASHAATPRLDQRDLEFLRIAAALVAEQLERDTETVPRDQMRTATLAAIRGEGLRIVYQPIVDLRSREVVALEALSRFTAEPPSTPDVWFARAWQIGLGPELELAAARLALADLDRLPAQVSMAVNFSPDALLTDGAVELFSALPEGRVVVEVTEHAPIHDHGPLASRLDELRGMGVRCALDDMGTGYAGLTTLVELRPEVHKIDRSIVRGVRDDPSRRALVAGWVAYAGMMGATVVAEGIETAEELEALEVLGLRRGQGYHLARPVPLEQLALTPSV